jgi:queuosine precursor transporter
MKNSVSPVFMLFGILFTACLLVSNILAIKIITIGSWAVPAGVIIFPISYIVNDVIVEIWGYRKARFVIWMGFGMMVLSNLMYQLAVAIPAAPFWTNQESFAKVLESTPRIGLASIMAYLCGSFANAIVMSKMKIHSNGSNFSLRAILSTVAGEGLDSVIFIGVAFAGIIPVKQLVVMALAQTFIKTAYEIIILPVTIIVVNKVKKVENENVFDTDISYNPFKLKEV